MGVEVPRLRLRPSAVTHVCPHCSRSFLYVVGYALHGCPVEDPELLDDIRKGLPQAVISAGIR